MGNFFSRSFIFVLIMTSRYRAEIAVEIINDDEYEKNEDFYLELGQPIWHREGHYEKDAELGKPILSDHPRCKIVITEDREFKVKFYCVANADFIFSKSLQYRVLLVIEPYFY